MNNNYSGNIDYKINMPTIEDIRESLQRLTKGLTVTADELRAKSPIAIPEERSMHAPLFFRSLFDPDDLLHVVQKCYPKPSDTGAPHICPVVPGNTATAKSWADYCEIKGTPYQKGGAWVCFNPVTKVGTGKNGAYRDCDVTTFKFTLLECDELSMSEQMSLFAHLELPIAAITTSGGKSLHALVACQAKDVGHYKNLSKNLHHRLVQLGVDPTTSNPSRLTRLPGAVRTYLADGDGIQRLLYLNPTPEAKAIINY